MRAAATALAVIFAALAQVTIAPLFPIRGAVPDFVLTTMVVVAVYAGPRAAMVALPFAALFTAFTTDRGAGLLIVAYLPLAPLAFLLAEANLPLTRFMQTLAVSAATGLWARAILSSAVLLQGAAFSPRDVFFIVLLPGVVLDLILVAMVYAPFRLARLNPQPATLQGSSWR